MKAMINEARICIETMSDASRVNSEASSLYTKAVKAYTMAIHFKDYDNKSACIDSLNDMYMYLDAVSDIFETTY
jgi:hypothetical protein